jgi:hypothetical protein
MILAIDAGNSRGEMGLHDGTSWSGIANVSLIEFAASYDHVNPFSATHDEPARRIVSLERRGRGAHQLIVNWTSIFEARPNGSAASPSFAACATATSGQSSWAPTAGRRSSRRARWSRAAPAWW